MLERTVEAHLVKRVKALGGQCIKLVPASHAGLPDRLVLLPRGRVFFVETKRPKDGQVRPVQRVMHSRLRDVGQTVVVLSSTTEVDQWLDSL